MPRYTWDTKADWDAMYSIGAEPQGHDPDVPELRANFERRVMEKHNRALWDNIIIHYPFMSNLDTPICVIGCAFGWSIEYLVSLGYTDVWGSDPSVYIQGAKDETDPADGRTRSEQSAKVRPQNLAGGAGEVNQFLRDTGHRNGPGGETPFDLVVTEDVFTSLEDAECTFVSGQIRTMDIVKEAVDGGQQLHSMTLLRQDKIDRGRADPVFNWKTLEDWALLLPLDDVTDSNGKRFL